MTPYQRRIANSAASIGAVIGIMAVVVWLGLQLPPPAPPISPSGQQHSLIEGVHAPPRSSKWHGVEKAYKEAHPNCQACGRTAKQSGQAIEVHHVVPFHDDESKELDPENLIALCRRCHELLGHLDKWSSYNSDVREDADRMLKKIKARP